MSTAIVPLSTPSFDPAILGQVNTPNHLDDLNLVHVPIPGLRRRANQLQGRGLEILGHAVEYLVDSRMFMVDQPSTRADAEAVQILMLLSRQVFAECAEVTPPTRRLRSWIAQRLNPAATC
jgi:hypothetical protein